MKEDERRCSRCAKIVQMESQVCRYCGHSFSAAEIIGYAKVESARTRNAFIGCCAVLGLVGLLAAYLFTPSEENKKAAASAAAAKEKADLAAQVERHKQGFHCLSGWDGSNLSFVEQVKQRLRNPSSFEHVDTRIARVNRIGKHPIVMEYRAQNGFGGMNLGQAVGLVNTSNCSAEVLSID